MSSFLALRDFTCPLSCFLAKEMPPDGAIEAGCATGFFPSCILPEAAFADVLLLAVGTVTAWNVACGRGSFGALAGTNVLLIGAGCSNVLLCKPASALGS